MNFFPEELALPLPRLPFSKIAIAVAAALLATAACGSSRESYNEAATASPKTEAPGDKSGLGSSGGGAKEPTGIGTLTGTVFAPEGTVPISNALLYLARAMPQPLPAGVYCDKCVQLDAGTPYTYSKFDGTFSLPIYSEGPLFLVVQKGNFRRVRPVTVKAGNAAVPNEWTTFPGASDPAHGDEIPRIAIAYGGFDKIELSLHKLGLKSFDRYGKDLFLDPEGLPPSVGMPFDLVNSAEKLSQYHIVLLPCSLTGKDCGGGPSDGQKENLRNYVGAGGKLYVTDYSYEYVNQTWPGFITWKDADGQELTPKSAWGAACLSGDYAKKGTANDSGLASWLGAIGEKDFDLLGNWTMVSKVSPMPGTDPDGKPVTITPKVWMTSNGVGPATVSFENQCGRVLFSTYHAEGGATDALLAQEKALLYILLEVGVCVGKPPPIR